MARHTTNGMTRVASDTVPSRELLERILADYEKIRNYRVLPVFSFFLLFLGVLLYLNKVNYVNRNSNFYVMRSALAVLHNDDFSQIGTVDDFFVWLAAAVRSVYLPASVANAAIRVTQNALLPVGLLLVRQQRSAPESCRKPLMSIGGTLSSAMETTGEVRCRSSLLSTSPFGGVANATSPLWSTTFGGEWFVKDGASSAALDIFGQVYKMDQPDSQFVTVFYLNESFSMLSPMPPGPSSPVSENPNNESSAAAAPPTVVNVTAALNEVDQMRRLGWFDALTQIVTVDALLYSGSSHEFTRVSLVLEQLPCGLLIASKQGAVMVPVVWGRLASGLSFFTDIVLFMFTVGLTLDQGLLVRSHWVLHRRITRLVGVWDILTGGLLTLLWIVFVLRMQLWQLTLQSNRYDGLYPARATRKMFADLSLMTMWYRRCYDLLAVALVLCGFKLLRFFKSVVGFNLVSETVRLAIGDIVGLLFISGVLITVFSIIATILFGNLSEAFSTFGNSFSSLIRAIVSAEIEALDSLLLESPRVTVLFFGTLFFLLWLIVLNLVLGILVTGFAAAKELNAARAAIPGELETFTQAIRQYVLLRGIAFKDDQRLAPRYKGLAMSSSVATASMALRTQMPLRQRFRRLRQWESDRFRAVIVLREEMERPGGKLTMDLKDLSALLPFMEPEHRKQFFRVVQMRILIHSPNVSQGVQDTGEIAYLLMKLQRTTLRTNYYLGGGALPADVSLESSDESSADEYHSDERTFASPARRSFIADALRASDGVTSTGSVGRPRAGAADAGLSGHSCGTTVVDKDVVAAAEAGAAIGNQVLGLRRTGRLVVDRRPGYSRLAGSSAALLQRTESAL